MIIELRAAADSIGRPALDHTQVWWSVWVDVDDLASAYETLLARTDIDGSRSGLLGPCVETSRAAPTGGLAVKFLKRLQVQPYVYARSGYPQGPALMLQTARRTTRCRSRNSPRSIR